MKKLLAALGLVLPLIVAAPKPAAADIDVVAHCIGVENGDTIVVELGGRERYVRLAGVDVAPLDPYDAGRSRAFLSDFVLGKNVRIDLESWAPDPDGALVGYVYLRDRQATFVNLALIANGYAVVWSASPAFVYRDRFYDAEHRAYEAHRAWWASAEHRERYGEGGWREPESHHGAPAARNGVRYEHPEPREQRHYGGGGGAGDDQRHNVQPGWNRGNGHADNARGHGGNGRGEGHGHGDDHDQDDQGR